MLFGLMYLVFFIAVAPVTIRLDVAVNKGLTGALTFSVWGVGKTVQIGSEKDEKGRLVLRYYIAGSKKRHKREAGAALLSVFDWLKVYMKGDKTRWLAEKSIHFIKIRAVLRISLKEAAHTAVLSVAAQELIKQLSAYLTRSGIRHAIRAWPDFSFQGSAMQGSCILFVRLGNLLALGAMMTMLVRRAKKAKEAAQWNTQLGT